MTTTFRLVVTGDTDLKHLDRLIRILRLQKEILEEDECSPATTSLNTSPIITGNASAVPSVTGAETPQAASTDVSKPDGEGASALTGNQPKPGLGTNSE